MTFTIRGRGLLIAASIAVLIVGGGVAYATIPGGGGVIQGCYDKKGGLRVIDVQAGEACKNNETSLDWGQTGPQGSQGIQGAQGIQGLQGLQGLPGQAGGLSGLERVFGNSATLNQTIGEVSSVAFCPVGKQVISGGYTENGFGSGGSTSPFTIIDNYPSTSNPKDGSPPIDSWSVTAAITSSNTIPSFYVFRAIAICANVIG